MADGNYDTIQGYGKALFGRRVIYSDVDEVTEANVLSVLFDAYPKHVANRSEINYLYDYYKGDQPILKRVKEVRPEICNKVVVNFAYDIVDFKVSYLCGSPFAYVSKKEQTEAVNRLNDYMNQVGKEALDRELIEWNHICGTAYRYVQAIKPEEVGEGEAPYDLFVLDPRTTFVIYSSTFKKKRLAAVTYTQSDTTGTIIKFVVYTPEKVFTFNADVSKEEGKKFIESASWLTPSNNTLGEIPIFEYPANNARLGAFEIVLPLLDAYNRITSNDVDGIEQAIQTFLKFINCELDNDALENLRRYGAIKIKSTGDNKADVEAVKTDYSFDGSNVTKEDLYRTIRLICGLPIMGNGKSISANNGAITLSAGWSQAENKAKASEVIFKASERLMLKLVLKICDTNGKEKIDIRASEIDCKSPRTNYENLQVKVQALCEMLNTQRVHPKLAFEACGLFSDPENAYLISEIYYNEQLEKWQPKNDPDNDGTDNEDGVNDNGETETVRPDGLTDSNSDNGTA